MSLNNQNSSNNKRLKYVSVPQDTFKFEYRQKKRIDSDDNYAGNNVNIKYDEEIDHRIKINEICLFSQHNESEWNESRSKFKLVQILVYLLGLFITLASLSNSIWLLFFSRFNFLLTILDLYEKFYNELIDHSLIIYFAIEIFSLLIDIVKGFYVLRLFQLLNLEKTFTLPSILDYELSSERIDLEKKLIESVEHLKRRIEFRKFFKSIKKSLVVLDVFLSVYFLIFVFVAKIVVSVFMLVDIKNLKSITTATEKFSILLADYWNYSDRVYATFDCDYFKEVNQTEIKSIECLETLHDNLLFLYIFLSVILIVTALFKFLTQLIQFYIFKAEFLKKLVRMHDKNDLELSASFENSKKMIVEKCIENVLEENARFVAKNILNSSHEFEPDDTFEKKNDSDDDAFDNDDNHRYINGQLQNYVNFMGSIGDESQHLRDDEKRAIDLIDKATENTKK